MKRSKTGWITAGTNPGWNLNKTPRAMSPNPAPKKKVEVRILAADFRKAFSLWGAAGAAAGVAIGKGGGTAGALGAFTGSATFASLNKSVHSLQSAVGSKDGDFYVFGLTCKLSTVS